jgi:hypothetical protein
MLRKQFYYGSCAMLAAVAMAFALGNDGRTPNANAQVSASPPPVKVADPNRPVTTQDGQPIRQADAKRDHQACRASELIGMNVRGREGDDNIGEIKDLMIQHDGRVAFAAVSFGGFLGIGDKMFAVPCEAIQFVKDGDNDLYARIDVSEETLKNREGFDKDHWPERADRSFVTSGFPRQVERPTTGTANPR